MVRRQIVALFLTGILFSLWATPALAGGWAIVTLDDLPRTLNAGETVTLGFMVRQHGVTPVNLENVILTAIGPDGEALTFTARQEGTKGHYLVDVTLPSGGEWAWAIQPDWFAATELAPITVIDHAAPAMITDVPKPFLPELIARIGTLVLNWFLGIDTAMETTALPVATRVAPAHNVTMTDIAYGRALFIAKGCNSCHLHSAAPNTWSVEMGPDLTGYRLPTAYLRAWLTDPKNVKPQTQMPNLALNATEIDALIAFLPSTVQ